MKPKLRLSIVVLASALALGARAPERRGEPPPAAPLHDCNGNGVDDTVDIALGSSSDSNLDGVPDECQEPSRPF